MAVKKSPLGENKLVIARGEEYRGSEEKGKGNFYQGRIDVLRGYRIISRFGQLLPLLVDFPHCVNIDRYVTNGKNKSK